MCKSCGRELVLQENPPGTGRGQSYWRRACECVIEPEPENDLGFTAEEVSKFTALVAARGLEPDSDIGLHLMSSLAATGTKVVLEFPGGDIVITAQEAEEAIGRPLSPGRS